MRLRYLAFAAASLVLAAFNPAPVVVNPAHADVIIDFAGPKVTGNVVAAPGGVVASNLEVSLLTTTGTPANAGAFPVVNGKLHYQSGSYINTVGNASFYNDGTFTLMGSIPSLGIGQETLASGSLLDFTVLSIGNTLKIVAAGGPDTKAADLLEVLGLSANTAWVAALSDNVSVKHSTGVTHYNGTSSSFDVSNKMVIPVPVPEPSSLAMLGGSLVAMGLYLRRRKQPA